MSLTMIGNIYIYMQCNSSGKNIDVCHDFEKSFNLR